MIEHAWRWSRRNRGIAAFASLLVASLILTAVVGWTGYVLSSLAYQGQKNSREVTEHKVKILHQLIMEMSQSLFPEDALAETVGDEGPVPLADLRLLAKQDPNTARTFSDRSDAQELIPGPDGPGGPGGPGSGPGGPRPWPPTDRGVARPMGRGAGGGTTAILMAVPTMFARAGSMAGRRPSTVGCPTVGLPRTIYIERSHAPGTHQDHRLAPDDPR